MPNPYFQPYTMPDGSTRRPIVERVPEIMNAAGLAYPNEDAEIASTVGNGLVFWIHKGDAIGSVSTDSVAIALCRCACEDWLREAAPSVELDSPDYADHELPEHVEIGWYPSYGKEPAVKDRDTDRTEIDSTRTTPPITILWYEGQTIHHALVAAAHAVADAKGIEP